MQKIEINKAPSDLPDKTRLMVEELIKSRIGVVRVELFRLLHTMGIGIAEATTVEDVLERVRTKVGQIYQSESERIRFRPIKNAFIRKFQQVFPEIQFKSKNIRIDVILKMIHSSLIQKEFVKEKSITIEGINYRYGRYHEIVLFCKEHKVDLGQYMQKKGGIRKSWRDFCEFYNNKSFINSRGWVLPRNIENVTKKSDKTFTEWISDILK